MDDHKRWVATSVDEDIITNFSEHLIELILERLPINDAVRTSVLSKKWRYRWTTMRVLTFNQQFSEKLSKNGALSHNGFVRIINKIMISHKGPILKFVLNIPKEIVLDSFQEVDLWMLILSRNSVKELTIVNFNRIYPIPSFVFSCLELRKLLLYNCIFNPPLEFQGFPNLETFRLLSISFRGKLGQTVIDLPQLKELLLYNCGNFNNFNIMTEKLQTLSIKNCLDATLPRLLHSEHLDVVDICLLKPKVDFLRVENFNLVMMLSNFPNIVSLTIDGYFLKVLAAEKLPKWLPHEVKCLKQLEFQSFSFGDLDQLQGALCMLRNSPTLEVLRVTHMEEPEADLELTSNYLESPNCLDQTFFMLQTVEITSLDGSRPELLFIKLLLDHSPRLESIIIRPRSSTDSEKRLNIAKDVILFPRASPKAKMVYLDPEY